MDKIDQYIGRIEKVYFFYAAIILLIIGTTLWTYRPGAQKGEGHNLITKSELKAATDIYGEGGELDRKGRRYFREGVISGNRRDIIGASHNFEKAMKYFKKLYDDRAIALTNLNLAYCYRTLKRNQDALNCFEKALLIARNEGYEEIEAGALRGIGIMYYFSVSNDTGLARIENAMDIHRRLGDAEAITDCLIMGALEQDRDPDRAADYFKLALEISMEAGDNRTAQEALRFLKRCADGGRKTIRLANIPLHFKNL